MNAQAEPVALAARVQAQHLARLISVHHQDCRACQRGGVMQLTRRGLTRVRCETERGLFAELDQAQQEGWPDVSTVR